jgi:hypothetical protein
MDYVMEIKRKTDLKTLMEILMGIQMEIMTLMETEMVTLMGLTKKMATLMG